MSDENVQVQFGADTGKAESGIKTIGDRLNELSEVASKAFEANQLVDFGEKLVELGNKVAEFAEHFANMGEAVNRATQILGLSTKEFQEFAFAIRLTGGDAESAVQTMTRFEKNIGEAARGAGEAAPFFKAIGISLKDLQTQNPDQIIKRVADAFHDTADGIEKVTVATAIGGRGFGQMIPLLNEGAAGLDEIAEKMRKVGDYLTELQKVNFQITADNIKMLDASFEGFGITLFDAIRPAIDNIVSGFTELVAGFNDAIKVGGEWHVVLKFLVSVLDGVIETIDLFIQGIRTLYDVTILTIADMIVAWQTLAKVMEDVLSGNWSRIDDDYKAGMAKIEAVTIATTDRIESHWKGFADRMKHAAQGVADMDSPSGDPKKGSGKPTIKLPGDTSKEKEAAAERLKIYTDEVNAQMKIREIGLQDEKSKLDTSVKLGLITEQQKFAYLTAFANQEAQIKAQAIQTELKNDKLKEAQKQKLYQDLLILERKHQLDLAQIQRQAQVAEMQRYHQVFASIDSAFKGMIQGVLQGTQTWKQALSGMFTNILVSFAGMLEEMAMKWVENQIMMAIFGKTEAAGIISGHAAEGAAAAYASIAAIPVVGPGLAPAAAAQAYTSIMAFNALPSFDVGAWDVQGNGAAIIHDKEMIVPAGPAQAFRDAMSGNTTGGGAASSASGSGDIHLHVHAIDAGGVKKFFQNNKGDVAAALKSAARAGDKNVAALMKH